MYPGGGGPFFGFALTAASIPAAPVRTYSQAARDPHVRERDMLQACVPPGGGPAIPLTGPAAKLSRTPTRVRAPAPALGQDNLAILQQLGYSLEAVSELVRSEVIGDVVPDAPKARRPTADPSDER